MATVTSLIQSEGPKLSEVQIEIQNIIDARRKLQNLITGLNNQHAEVELAFLREFSRDVATLKLDFDRSFVDGAFSLSQLEKAVQKKTPESQAESAAQPPKRKA
ncbi:MAG: hypothetical protein L0Z46_08820 [Nitrospiraceae bacterium]|nr:hypothetical protein [Nitrospiraceae bacterium]